MKDRIYKVLSATGIEALDKGISTLESCEVVGISKGRSDLYDDIDIYKPQIVIVSDWLNGNNSVPDLLRDLKRQNHYVRFIYLAGQLDPRNQTRIDELGRIVLPIEIRKNLNLGSRDAVEIFVNEDTIVLKKYEPACIFCGSMDNASLFRGKIICDKCLSELKKTDCDNADS